MIAIKGPPFHERDIAGEALASSWIETASSKQHVPK
jgi:hypothetical protein